MSTLLHTYDARILSKLDGLWRKLKRRKENSLGGGFNRPAIEQSKHCFNVFPSESNIYHIYL